MSQLSEINYTKITPYGFVNLKARNSGFGYFLVTFLKVFDLLVDKFEIFQGRNSFEIFCKKECLNILQPGAKKYAYCMNKQTKKFNIVLLYTLLHPLGYLELWIIGKIK